MAAVAAKPASAPSLELDADEQRKMNAICRSAFLAATAVAMCVPARAPMVLAMKKGDAAATAKTMGGMSTAAAAIEFLLNPILGRLSDKYGRKPFLLMSASVNMILHSLVTAFPGSLPIQVLDRSLGGAMIFCFFNPLTTSLQDLFAGNLQKMGAQGAKVGAHFGMGFALGPALGAKLAGRNAFAVSAAVFGATAASIQLGYEETLPVENRKEFEISAANPFSFVKLFSTKPMAQLCTTLGFSSFAEYPNIYDINFLFMNTVMGYGQREFGLFGAGFGVTQILGGIFGKQIITSLGLKSSTLLGNLAYIVGFGLLGTAKGVKQLVLALACMTWGHGLARTGYPGNLLQEHATKMGMGRGEIAGAQANFTAVLKIIAPTAYGRLFAWATSGGRNMPGLPYLAICMCCAVAQLNFSNYLANHVEDAKKTTA